MTRNDTGPAFELKGTAATLTVLRLHTVDIARIEHDLAPRVAQLPHFFQNAPVVLDLEPIEEGLEVPFEALLATLRRCHLVPVAVRNAEGPRLAAALEAGLGQLKGGAPRSMRSEQSAPSAPPQAESVAEAPTPASESNPELDTSATMPDNAAVAMVAAPVVVEAPVASLTIKSPVRGGQVIYAQGTDLVLLGPVNPGGEVIADGNIHAYAPIRGRALAGAHGNEDARIFCKSLDAELVSIAGNYLSADDLGGKWRGKAAQVRLSEGKLLISEL